MTRATHIKAKCSASTCRNLLTLTIALAIKPIIADGEETSPPHKRAKWDNEVDEVLTEWTTISQELPPDEVAAMEASIFSAVSEAMKEETLRSRVLHMLSQVGSKNNVEAPALHEAVPCTSSFQSPVEACPGPSRLMMVQGKSDQHRLMPDKTSRLHPTREFYRLNLRPGPPSSQVETRDMTPTGACVGCPPLLSTANGDKTALLEAIRCSLEYIARCYEAGQGADPIDNVTLSNVPITMRFEQFTADMKACIIFDPNLDFRLLRLLLTAWNNQLPVIKIAGYTNDEHQSLSYLLNRLLSWEPRTQPFLTIKCKYYNHRTWMLSLMLELAAEIRPITPTHVLLLMVKDLKKKLDCWRLSKTGEVDPDAWVPGVPLYPLSEAAKGAAKLLHLFARCPLTLLTDAELWDCFQSLKTACGDPVDVCEKIWHITVTRTQQVLTPTEYKKPKHWINIGPFYKLSPIASALYSTAHKEGFWARVSWLFHHKFAPVAKRVETIWSLPHERQEAKDIVDVAAAIDACVGEAHQELSSQVPSCVGINFASVCSLVPAITLLKTHKAILVLPSDSPGSDD